MILTPQQAQTVYAAMCLLNNIHARMDTTVVTDGGDVKVTQYAVGSIDIYIVDAFTRGAQRVGGELMLEFYRDQEEFAMAYGLNLE